MERAQEHSDVVFLRGSAYPILNSNVMSLFSVFPVYPLLLLLLLGLFHNFSVSLLVSLLLLLQNVVVAARLLRYRSFLRAVLEI